MARQKMNFGVGINLDAKKFRKGANQVNGYLKGMKSHVLALSAAFGVGAIGMGNFFSKVFSTVKELNSVQTKLKNVTKTTTAYNDALKYLNDTAGKYKQNITTLTDNYAKFVAASEGSGMALGQIRDLFTSIAQASTYFGLSAEKTDSAMLAFTQMMSKGKVQAEELRVQLAEHLPGAQGIFARALGVTTKEFNKLMESGKLLAGEVLPKVAEQLKLETAGFDADTLQGAMSEMKNTWTKLWDSPDIQNAFKKLVNGLTSAMQWAANNIQNIFNAGIAVMIAYASSMMNKMLAKFDAMQKTIALRYADVVRKGNNLGMNQSSFGYSMSDMFKPEHHLIVDQYADAMRTWLNPQNPKEFAKGLKNCNELLKDMKYQGVSFSNVAEKWEKELEPINLKFNQIGAEVGGVDNAARMFANHIDNSTKKTTVLGKTWQFAGVKVKQFGDYLKNMVYNNWITALIALFYFLGKTIWDTVQKAKELKNLTKDTLKGLDNTKGYSTTLNAVEAMLKEYQKVNGEIDKQKKLLSDIQKLLGLKEVKGEDRLETEKRINEEFAKRKKLILEEARAQAAASKIVELETRRDELADKIKERAEQGTGVYGWFKPNIKKLQKEYNAVVETLSEVKDKYGKLVADYELNKLGDAGGLGADIDEAREKVVADYIKKWNELSNQLSNGVITEREYQESIYKLAQEVRENLGKFDNLTKAEQSIVDFLGTIQNASEIVEDAFKNIQVDLATQAKELASQLKYGAITQDEYNEAMYSLYNSIIKNMASLGDLNDEQVKVIEALKKYRKEYEKPISISKVGDREALFDYRLSDTEIKIKNIEFDIEAAKTLEEELKKAIENGAENLDTALNAAMANVKSLEDALKVQQVKADIKDLQKQLQEGAWAGVKSLAQSSDRLVSSFQSLKEVMNDDEATNWEKLITVFNTLIQSVDTLVGLFETINNITKVAAKLTKATAAESVATKSAEASAIVATTTATTVETGAKIALAKANEAVAVTGAAAAMASIPLVGPVLAANAATSTKALLASLAAFEKGGIVGGNSFTGDKNIVRVNSGEMILNKGQQSTLFGMLNGKGGMGGNVEFKLKGSDLYGCFSNYNKKTSRY